MTTPVTRPTEADSEQSAERFERIKEYVSRNRRAAICGKDALFLIGMVEDNAADANYNDEERERFRKASVALASELREARQQATDAFDQLYSTNEAHNTLVAEISALRDQIKGMYGGLTQVEIDGLSDRLMAARRDALGQGAVAITWDDSSYFMAILLGLHQDEDEGCPVGDPDCTSRDDECHDACEAPAR